MGEKEKGKKGKFKKRDGTCVEYEIDDELVGYFEKRIKKTEKKKESEERW